MIDITKLTPSEIAEVRAMYLPHHRYLRVGDSTSSTDFQISYSICALLERLFGEQIFSDKEAEIRQTHE